MKTAERQIVRATTLIIIKIMLIISELIAGERFASVRKHRVVS